MNNVLKQMFRLIEMKTELAILAQVNHKNLEFKLNTILDELELDGFTMRRKIDSEKHINDKVYKLIWLIEQNEVDFIKQLTED